jgi:uncharacterized protein
MPQPLAHPGVYIEEIPSGVRAIASVGTSITAFVGRTWRGPTNEPVPVFSYGEFERAFGGLWRNSSVGYAVQHYFLNGGSQALVVRTANGDTDGSIATAPATITIDPASVLVAANPGTWGRNLLVTVDYLAADPATQFNVTIFDDPGRKEDSAARGGSGAREIFRNLSVDPNNPRFVTKILAEQSKLVRVQQLGAVRPAEVTDMGANPASGSDGVIVALNSAEAINAEASQVIGSDAAKTGIHALLKTDLFNLLYVPPLVFMAQTGAPAQRLDVDVPTNVLEAGAALCSDERAMLVVDAPRNWDVTAAQNTIDIYRGAVGNPKNAAIYFPRLRLIDPLQDGQLEEFAPGGVVAGIIARTDSSRGVWKAPAGTEAGLGGVLGLSINGSPATLTDGENGLLNPRGINCLRNLPGIGHVVWGARTLEGADMLASQWKYLPVRRLALFIEESLFRGTQWVVFEPNDEPLWAQIRLNVGSFMHSLFIDGAFQGATPREAYFVKCSHETTTQTDIDNGIVNIEVGFAPLKPAEFVVIKIQQLSPQAQA